MKHNLVALVICLPTLIFGQDKNVDTSINWVINLSWEQVLKKAKESDKYIFVDCFATWCMPCKHMDKNVFANKKVVSFVNDKFISVKIQLDSTENDPEEIRKCYKDAQTLRAEYKVKSLPTYLFFSPGGKVVHKDVGVKTPEQFFDVLKNSIDEQKQYFVLLNRYFQNNLDDLSKKYLAESAKQIEENEIAESVAKNFMNSYLVSLGESQLFTKSNIDFIKSFTRSTKDKWFKWLVNNSAKIDSVMNVKFYSDLAIDNIISAEIIDPFLIRANNSKSGKPNWNKLSRRIQSKLDKAAAERNVLSAQEKYFLLTNNWEELHKIYVKKFRKYGVFVFNEFGNIRGVTNNMAFDIFLKSSDRSIIEVAAEWMQIILAKMDKTDPLTYAWTIDTYSNLIYKLGRTNAAIDWESKALTLAQTGNDKGVIRVLEETIEKMKKGLATWPK